MTQSEKDVMTGLPDDLCLLVEATDRRRRRLAGLQGLVGAVLVMLIGAAIVVLGDSLGNISDTVRTLLSSLLWVTVLALVGVRAVWPWLRRESPVQTARRIESAADGDLHERFSAAVALVASSNAQHWMVRRTVALAGNEVAGVRPAAAVPSAGVQKRLRLLAVVALPFLLSLAWADARVWWGRAMLPWADILRPAEHRVDLLVDDHLRVVRGRQVEIAVVVDPDPKTADMHVQWADGRRQRLPLNRGEQHPEGRRFDRQIDGVMQDAALHVVAADGRSRTVRIEVLDPPQISNARMRLTPPEYTGLGTRSQNAGPLTVLVGTTVSLVVETTGPGIESLLVVTDDPAAQLPLQSSGDGRWVLDGWQPDAEQACRWRLAMVDAAGGSHVLAGPWALQTRSDQAPQVQLAVIGGENYFATDEVISLELQAEDDIALESLDLVMEDRRRGGWIHRTRPLPLDAPHRGLWQRRHFIDLAALAAEPDGTLVVELVAVDIGGQEGRSGPLVIHIADRDAVADHRRGRRLRALQADVEGVRRRLDGVRSQLRPLTVGISESDAHDIFMADLRRTERGVRHAVADLQTLVAGWPYPIDDEIGRAEAGLRLRAEAWRRIYGGDLLRATQHLRRADEGAMDDLLKSLDRSLDDIDLWLSGIVLCAAATESGDLARQSSHDQRRAESAASVLEAHLAWIGPRRDRDEHLAATMARVPPALARRAWEDLRQALSAGHEAVRMVTGWADEVTDRDLQRIRADIGRVVMPVPSVALSALDQATLVPQTQSVRAVAEYSAAAQRRLERLLRDWRPDRDHPLALDDGLARQLGDHLRERTEHLQRERDPERRGEILADIEATDRALQEMINERRRDLRRAMVDRDATTARQRDLREASRRLRAAEAQRERLAEAVAEARREPDQRPDLRREGRDLQRATQELSGALAEVRQSAVSPHRERALRAMAQGDQEALEQAVAAMHDALQAAGRDQEAAAVAAAEDDRRALAAVLDELRPGDDEAPDDLRAAARELGRLAEEWSADTVSPELQSDILADAASILAEQAARQDDERAADILDRARAALADEEHDRAALLAQQAELLEDMRRGRVDLDDEQIDGAPALTPAQSIAALSDPAAELAAVARELRRLDEEDEQVVADVLRALDHHPELRALVEQPGLDPQDPGLDDARHRQQLSEDLKDRRHDVIAAEEAQRAADDHADQVRQRVVEELAATAAEIEAVQADLSDEARAVLEAVARQVDERRRQLEALSLLQAEDAHRDPFDDDRQSPGSHDIAAALDQLREALSAVAEVGDQDGRPEVAVVDDGGVSDTDDVAAADMASADVAAGEAGAVPADADLGADEPAMAAAADAPGDAAPGEAGAAPADAAPGADDPAVAAADGAPDDAAPGAADAAPADAAPGVADPAMAAADGAPGDAAAGEAGAAPADAAPGAADPAVAAAPGAPGAPGDAAAGAPAAAPGAGAPGSDEMQADPVARAEAALAAAHEALRQAAEAGDARPADLAMAAAEYQALAEDMRQRAEQHGRVVDVPDARVFEEALQRREMEEAAQHRQEALRRQAVLAAVQEEAEQLIDHGVTPLAQFWSDLDAAAQAQPGHRALADMGQHLATLAHDLVEASQTANAAGQHQEFWADQLAATQDRAWQAVGEEAAVADAQPAVPLAAAQQAFADLAAARQVLEEAEAHPHLAQDHRHRRERAQERVQAAQQAVEEHRARAMEAAGELMAAVPAVPAQINPTASAAGLAAQAAQSQQQADGLRALADHLGQEGEAESAASVAASAQLAAAEAAAARSQLQSRDPLLDQQLAAGAQPPADAPPAAGMPPASGAPAAADAPAAAPGPGEGAPAQAAAQAAAAAAAGQAAAAAAQAMQPGAGSGDGGNIGPAEPSELRVDEAPEGIDQAAWARLPERERRAIRDQRGSTFSEEQQAAIRAYTRRLLAEE